MAPKTKINMKERLEDGELDLSLSDLQEVPVKEIALMKKATSLDLSNNRLVSLGKNFSILTHIVKLDLSKNLLTELPEDFGQLKQLKHLDLYSNQLTYIPLSFHNLKNLRWLDLKNNPLNPTLQKVAGPCLDAPQCTQCAKSVVAFYIQMNEQIEEKIRVQEQSLIESKNAQQKEVQKKKEKKKTKKDKKIKGKGEKNQEIVQAISAEEVSSTKKPLIKKKSKPSKSNLCLSLFKLIFYSLLFSTIFFFIFSSLKTEPSNFVKKRSTEIWNEAIKSVPSEYQPWITKIEDQVQNLHSMTGKMAENIVVFVDQVRKDERVNATMQMVWETLIVMGTESKKVLFDLGDQALVWTNEIKKSWKL